MSDNEIASLSFGVDTSGLTAGSDGLTAIERKLESATAAMARFEAATARAFAATKMNPAMAGLSGLSPMGGPTAAAGLQASASAAGAAASGYTGLATAATAAASAVAAHGHAASASVQGINAAAAAHKAHGASMGNSTLAALELAHVSRALFDEWAAGGNVIRGLMMEGGRLQILLGASGGLSGLFGLVTTKVGELGAKALGLANPFTLGTAAVVGFGAASLTALFNVRNLREEMDRAVSGAGAYAGLSGQGLDALARGATARSALSPSAGLPLADAREAAEAMARTGRIGADNIAGGLNLVRGYAAAFGTSYDEAGGKLADIFADPVRGADQLNERLGFLDARTRTYIQSLREQGDAQGAIAALQAAAAPSLNEQVKPPGAWERFSSWWASRNDQVEHGIAGYFGHLSPQERLDAAERDADNRRLMGVTSVDPADDPMSLSENIRRASQLRAQQQRDVIFNRSSLDVDSLIGRADPDAARYRSLQNQSKALGDALGNPDVADRLPDGMSSSGKLVSGRELLSETLDRINDKLANWMGGVEKSTLAVNANVMAIGAWTLGEHLAAASAQEMASLGIRQIRTSEELIAVQGRQADIIARANDKAANLDRDASDRLALAGKTGLERTLAENAIKFRDYRDQLVDMSGGKDLEGIVEAFLPAKVAATNFATVLDAARPKVETAGDRLAKSVDDLAARLDAAAGRITAATGGLGPVDAIGPFYPRPFTGRAGPVSDHERTMVDMLVQAGFTNRAADAGFVGGMAGESGTGLDPMARNGSGHRGIAQWEPTRFAGASAYGDPDAFLSQARLMIHELLTGESTAGDMLRRATTVEGGLAANFRTERPSQAEMASSYNARLAYGSAINADMLGPTPREAAPSVLTIRRSALPLDVPLPPERPGEFGGGTIAGMAAAASVPVSVHADAAAAARLPSASVLGVKLDTAGGIDTWTRNKEAAATIAATDVPLDRANTALRNQLALLDTQRDMFGQSAAAIRGATEAQTLWNSLVTNAAAPTGELAKQTGYLADKVRAYGVEAAAVEARRLEQDRMQKGLTDASDFARGSLSSVLTSGLTSAAHGHGFLDGLRNSLGPIGDQLMGRAVSGGVGALFGPAGSVLGSGGLFGGSPAAGGFGAYGPQLPDSSGGVGTVLARLLGTFFGGAHATGGRIAGPGTGTSDSILAQVSNGEFIVRADAARHYGALLDRINDGTLPRFADGGVVAPAEPMIEMPRGPVVGGGNESGGMGRGGGSSPVHIQLGDLHIHPTSGDQFSPSQLRSMMDMHAETQQRTVDQITRNLPAIQANSQQGN